MSTNWKTPRMSKTEVYLQGDTNCDHNMRSYGSDVRGIPFRCMWCKRETLWLYHDRLYKEPRSWMRQPQETIR